MKVNKNTDHIARSGVQIKNVKIPFASLALAIGGAGFGIFKHANLPLLSSGVACAAIGIGYAVFDNLVPNEKGFLIF